MQAYSDFIDSMAVLLGGFASEKIFFGEVTTGASNDLQRVTATARQIVTQFGMDEKLGPRTFGQKDEMILTLAELALAFQFLVQFVLYLLLL